MKSTLLTLALFVSFFMALCLEGCGQRGPLYLPQKPEKLAVQTSQNNNKIPIKTTQK